MPRDSIFSDRDLHDFLGEIGAPASLQKQAFDPGALVDQLKAEAVDGYHQVGQSLGGYAPTLIGGLAGVAAGGGAMYAASARRDNESQEEFEARRRSNAVTGAIGGGALGGAVPTVANHLFGAGKDPDWIDRVETYFNPFHNRASGALAGAAAGATAGTGFMSTADRLAGVKGDKVQNAINQSTTDLPKGVGENVRQNLKGFGKDLNGNPIHGPAMPVRSMTEESRLADLIQLQNKMKARGRIANVNPFGEIAGEQRRLQVGRGGPLTQLLRGALTAGGAMYGAAQAAPSDE